MKDKVLRKKKKGKPERNGKPKQGMVDDGKVEEAGVNKGYTDVSRW
jgi:hypothetical protein